MSKTNNDRQVMPDYSEPLSNAEVARNNPLYEGTYKSAEEQDDYYTMAETERDIRNNRRKPPAYYSRQVNAFVAVISTLIIMLMVAIILL